MHRLCPLGRAYISKQEGLRGVYAQTVSSMQGLYIITGRDEEGCMHRLCPLGKAYIKTGRAERGICTDCAL